MSYIQVKAMAGMNYVRANDILGRICASMTLVPYEFWRKHHNAHHSNNNRPHPVRDAMHHDVVDKHLHQRRGDNTGNHQQ